MAGLGPPLRTPETPSVGSTLDLAIPGGATRSTCLPRAPHHAPCLLRSRSAAPPSGGLRGERPPRHRHLAARSEEGRFSPTSAINHGIETCTRMDGRLPITVSKAETLDPMDPAGRARRARSGGRHLDGVRGQLRPTLESPPGFHPDDGHRPFLVSSAIARAFRTAPHRRGVFDRERGSWTDLGRPCRADPTERTRHAGRAEAPPAGPTPDPPSPVAPSRAPSLREPGRLPSTRASSVGRNARRHRRPDSRSRDLAVSVRFSALLREPTGDPLDRSASRNSSLPGAFGRTPLVDLCNQHVPQARPRTVRTPRTDGKARRRRRHLQRWERSCDSIARACARCPLSGYVAGAP